MLLCGWLHPTQWPIHAAWTAAALRVLAMCQFQHQAPAAPNTQLWREHRALCSWCSAGMAHRESTLNLLNLHRWGMLCTYVHLRIDIDLSIPLLHDEHNSHANSMQQMLQNSSENELIFPRPPLTIPTSLQGPAPRRENLHASRN